jgi:hypothetical protein
MFLTYNGYGWLSLKKGHPMDKQHKTILFIVCVTVIGVAAIALVPLLFHILG